MNAFQMSAFSERWIVAALVALACAGCTAPVVNAPAEPSKEAIASKNEPPSKNERDLEAAKKTVTPPAQPSGVPAPSKSEQELGKGIKSYEEGEYKTAAKQLQTALDLGLDTKRDQAKAHKYLAFISCVSGRKKACRDEFNKALNADPKFDLEPAEAGHPTWGPVFRSIKAERAAKSKSK